jgi:hypothetical protein
LAPSRLYSQRSLLVERGPEGWWCLFRRNALAGQSFANADEIEQAMRITTAQLNPRANPWI